MYCKCEFVPLKKRCLYYLYTVAGCCHYLFPRSISRLPANSVCARVCAHACLLICWCLGLSTSSCTFSHSEVASVNLNTCFCCESFPSGVFAAARSAFYSPWLLLHVCSRMSNHASVVGVCMTRTVRFCIKPVIDSPATGIASSLQSHTVFHSINSCPPP